MKAVILSILQNCPEPVKRSSLLAQLRSHNIVTTDRAMRKAVEEMIEEGECIASSEEGYYIIREARQIEKAVAYLKKKSKSIAVRGNLLIRNWTKKHPGQGSQLELFSE
jgi:hypothetical protein